MCVWSGCKQSWEGWSVYFLYHLTYGSRPRAFPSCRPYSCATTRDTRSLRLIVQSRRGGRGPWRWVSTHPCVFQCEDVTPLSLSFFPPAVLVPGRPRSLEQSVVLKVLSGFAAHHNRANLPPPPPPPPTSFYLNSIHPSSAHCGPCTRLTPWQPSAEGFHRSGCADLWKRRRAAAARLLPG